MGGANVMPQSVPLGHVEHRIYARVAHNPTYAQTDALRAITRGAHRTGADSGALGHRHRAPQSITGTYPPPAPKRHPNGTRAPVAPEHPTGTRAAPVPTRFFQ